MLGCICSVLAVISHIKFGLTKLETSATLARLELCTWFCLWASAFYVLIPQRTLLKAFAFLDIKLFQLSSLTDADLSSILETSIPLRPRTMRITVLCEFNENDPTHPKMLFEWLDRTGEVFRVLAHFCKSSETVTGYVVSDDDVKKGPNAGRSLLEDYTLPTFAAFDHPIPFNERNPLKYLKKTIGKKEQVEQISFSKFALKTIINGSSKNEVRTCALRNAEVLKNFGIDLGLTEPKLAAISTSKKFVHYAKGHELALRNNLIQDALDFHRSKLKISIVCYETHPYGDHCFVFCQWMKNSERMFATVDFGPASQDMTYDAAKISVVLRTGLKKGQDLLGNQKIRFTYWIKDKPNHIKDIGSFLEKWTREQRASLAYKIGGDKYNKFEEQPNHNCATFSILLLSEFGINININRWFIVRAPTNIIRKAYEQKINEEQQSPM